MPLINLKIVQMKATGGESSTGLEAMPILLVTAPTVKSKGIY